MVKLDDAIIARLEHSGFVFEILVDPDLAMELKKGAKINFDELLASDQVFKDSKRGEEASAENVKKVFGTNDIKEIAKQIIEKGRVQLTTEQRKQLLEKRRKEVISLIARNALNPQTKAPHPEKRIETAIEEARIQIDPTKSAPEQIEDIIKELKKLLPISMEKLKVAVKIPALYAGKAESILHKYSLLKEEWQRDGSLVAVLEVPAGIKADLFNELNHLTKGDVETKILE